MPYAARALSAMRVAEPLANVLIGTHGAEGLLLAEAGAASGITQLGGTADPSGAALLHATLGEALVGEEVFAAGAYLHRPDHLGSLATQDLVRIVIIIALVVGIALTSLDLGSALATALRTWVQ